MTQKGHLFQLFKEITEIKLQSNFTSIQTLINITLILRSCFNLVTTRTYHLLTESEVITGKSQTEALMY